MKGNAIRTWSTLLLAVCIWWAGIEARATGPAAWNSSTATCDGSEAAAPSYEKMEFEAQSADESAYGEMIARLRALLTKRGGQSHGIPVLPSQRTTLPEPERFVLLEIAGSRADGDRATFAIDATSASLVGYRLGDMAYFFQEAPFDAGAEEEQLLFPNTRVSPHRRPSSYRSLEQRAGTSRSSISLGLGSLASAVRTLASRPEDARALVTVIQMVAEAVRYWEIEARARQSRSFLPDTHVLGLEDRWGSLSELIQSSDHLAFRTPVTIGGMVADGVSSYVLYGLSLMLFACEPPAHRRRPSPSAAAVPNPMRRSALLEAGGSKFSNSTCERWFSPRRRIRGRDGLCVAVRDYNYTDGNPIVVSTCKDGGGGASNQLWTFLRNGTIVSLTKCLAASGGSVVIHQCDTIDAAAVEWSVGGSSGDSLIHARTGMHLTAAAGASGSPLMLEPDASSSFQAWKLTTSVRPVDAAIRGAGDQCVHYNGGRGVYTERCVSSSPTQRWSLYPDGTVRPITWLDGCLQLQSLSADRRYNYLQAARCDASPEHHRWVFTRQGSMMNLKSGLVVHADEDFPSYLKAAPYQAGLINQIWTLRFI